MRNTKGWALVLAHVTVAVIATAACSSPVQNVTAPTPIETASVDHVSASTPPVVAEGFVSLLGSSAPGPQYSTIPYPYRYGNWCGPKWSGGVAGSTGGSLAPVDLLDSACMKHDNAYATADAIYGRQYNGARDSASQSFYCKQWKRVYELANADLYGATARLANGSPQLIVPSNGPDTWHYDPAIWKKHPWQPDQRVARAREIAIAVILDVTNTKAIFFLPSCKS